MTLEGAPATIHLRDYQRDALTAVADRHGAGILRQLLVLPTGAGKTVVFSHLARDWGCRTLILAHRDELITQAANKVRAVLGGHTSVGIVKAEKNEIGAQILVASVQTLSRERRLAQFGTWRPDLLIIDECHHSSSTSYQTILKHFGMLAPAAHQLLLGVTATPDRADGTSIGKTVFDEIVYQVDMLQLMRRGYLCDFRALRVRVDINFNAIKRMSGDLAANALGQALQESGAGGRIVDAFCEYGEGRKAIVFTPTVAFAHDIALEFQSRGIAAEALDGTTAQDIREAMLTRLHSGETRVVINCGVLTEGFDEPSVDCIVMARPTKSRALYVQMIGRGSRPFPGKQDCLILDLVGTSSHDILSVPDIFNITDAARTASASMLEATVVQEALELDEAAGGTPEWAAKAQERREGRLVAETIDLFQGRQVRWLTADNAIFVVGMDDGALVLEERAGVWQAVHIHNLAGRPPRLRAQSIDFGYAQGMAEDIAHEAARGLNAPDAAWRAKKPSEKQVAFAASLGASITPDMRSGDVADEITLRKTLSSYRRLDHRARTVLNTLAQIAARGTTISVSDEKMLVPDGPVGRDERAILAQYRDIVCALLPRSYD